MRRALIVVVAMLAPLACGEPDEDSALARDTRSTPQEKTFKGRVNGTGTSGLRVRKDATTSSDQLTSLAEGTTVSIKCRKRGEIIEGNADWNFIPDKNGYASDMYIVIVEGNEADIPRCDANDAPSLPPASPTGGKVDIEGPEVQPHVQQFIDAACADVGACRASTYVGHSPQADLALDIPSGEGYGKLPTDNNVFGDKVADYALANQAKFKIEYVIYRQRINMGSGWEAMEDRGSITQNHFDHVHVSFNP